ncbi:MAG: SDR family NAD(P)-dependent oxidoreductase [Janthinobacterium lividum]
MADQSAYATYPSLRGRVVLVTGGASGIGEAIVRAFAQQGASVAFFDVQDEAAHTLSRSVGETGKADLLYVHCDLTDIAALQAAVQQVTEHFGTVDVLVNNAANDARHTLAEVTPESWDASIAVNLRHQFFMAQAVVPAMQRAGRGVILNMSSISWMIPSTGMPLYITAKAAIVGLTRTLAHELGKDNIRVNSVLPGAILTERQQRLWMTPEYEAEVLSRQALKRHILPDEVARLLLFLASDDSSAITNQSYIIDGGWM